MGKGTLRPDSDWNAPPITVFIAGSGRSGSNLLCSAMKSTGILGLPTEWLNLREMKRTRPHLISTAADCCRMIRMNGATPNGIASTKLLANHLTRLGAQISLTEWFPTQSWVYLRRGDRLGQAISRTLAVQTGDWVGGPPNRRMNRSPSYSREQISANLEQVQQADEMWAAYFEAQQIEPLTLWCEDIEQDLHNAIAQIALHVGGQPLADQLRGTPPYVSGVFDIRHRRQRSATNVEWRIRYLSGM